MALKLLKHVHACKRGSIEDSLGQDAMCSWIASLPQHPAILQEIHDAAQRHQVDWQVLQSELQSLGVTEKDFDWAASVLLSRSFVYGDASQHVTLPVIDMANHSLQPNATMNLVASPDGCQGQQAVEDVCDPQELTCRPAQFVLLTSQAISAGEEVTISYGPWPNDVLLQQWGFVPGFNPYDAVALFDNFEDLLCHIAACNSERDVSPTELSLEQRQQAAQRARALQEALEIEDTSQLLVTAEGLDQRLAWVMPYLPGDRAGKNNNCAYSGRPAGPGPLLAQRCGELLLQFSTSAAEDEALLTAGQLANDVELAVRFRLGKKLLLENAQRSLLANLNARPFMRQQLA
eukprot:jgi/Astpho2/122/fgenesh1_pg.00004_%23_31_t